uniref:Ribosomal RNA-processing protein 40 n=1 Tax=Trichobilharzia regenti TaxID=157069 RepID=A0AA85KED1_TRIRE|nr:unnamed protein product [Trichobilharzia regenti]
MTSAAVENIIHGVRLQTCSNESSYQNFVDCLVLPGMIFELTGPDKIITWSIGPGLVYVPASRTKSAMGKRKLADSVLVKQFGVLKFKRRTVENSEPLTPVKRFKSSDSSGDTEENYVWIESPSCFGSVTTLLPLSRLSYRCHVGQFQKEDKVIGIVIRRAGGNFVIDIGCATPATIKYQSFEGSSKKNRPDIHAGDVIFAMIKRADRDLEVELSCVDEAGKACGMGILGRYEPGTVGNAGGRPGGVLLHCTQDLIRRLGDQKVFPLLQLLSKVFPFEVFIGVNGRIWLTANSPRETMILANAIAIAEHIPNDECCKLAKELY